MQKGRAYLITILWLVVIVFFIGLPAEAVERITPEMLVAMEGKAVTLDARPKKVWAKGHIPGAISFNWEEYTKIDEQKIPYRTLPPQEMARVLGRLGIHESDIIVITGDADSSWGGEGWIAWTLQWIGHQGPVYLLSGGVSGWKNAGYLITKKSTPRPSTHYTPHPNPNTFMSATTLRGNLVSFTLIDTRSFREWITGHIPGAIHIPWKKMIDKKSRTPIPPEEMKALLIKKKVPLNKPIVYYCTGGVRSGWTWMAHGMAGFPTAINLEGGYEEWKRLE